MADKTINIDGKEYVYDQLPERAQAHLRNLQITDAEISRLETQLAICRTARNTYANALRGALKTGKKEG